MERIVMYLKSSKPANNQFIKKKLAISLIIPIYNKLIYLFNSGIRKIQAMYVTKAIKVVIPFKKNKLENILFRLSMSVPAPAISRIPIVAIPIIENRTK